MAEDWRVTVTLGDDSGRQLGTALDRHEIKEAEASLGGRVAVSAGPSRVLLYADTRAAAIEGQRVVASVLESNGKTATFTLERWHPVEAEWEPADLSLPTTEAEQRSERERREAQDTTDAEESGYATWEVRLDLPTHRDAVDLAERLQSEGLRPVRRWRYLLVGTQNEDEARALADRLSPEAPAGTTIQVQPGGEMLWEGWQKRPFALVGDLVD